MNGRIYDPTLGRFLQADPHIQAPMNSQNYNRYSYVLNNPLSYTDPSGYFFKKIGKFLKKNWRAIASIALDYVTFGLGTGVWGLAGLSGLSTGTLVGWGAASGFVSGAVSTGSLKGALQGAFSGAIFGAIGASGLSGLESFAASGLTGGIISDLQGGKFGHGFISAGIGAAMAGRFGKNPYAQVIGSAVVGGTISKLTGGKFANGALSAAFATALRADWNKNPTPKGSQVAFVGGAADDNPAGSRVVKDAYEAHITKYGKNSAAYFEWTEHEKFALWVDQTNGNGTVIAHSYGADMAAQVVANGHAVNRLITVDPVGWVRPDMSQVAANSNVWQNYDAGDSLNNWNNIVATAGGAWNSLPQGHATTHQRYGNLDHVQICQVFCKY
ncbi:RHS repeat-associated core domain-containing protein [Aliiglaciecola litoralis]|uniref:RHS repeat-associated core domain-containing protein n=1 Tax=Aliiglaciecola litoralis TaxID=582857 RepID=A0ABN1LIW8_9ALTE